MSIERTQIFKEKNEWKRLTKTYEYQWQICDETNIFFSREKQITEADKL